MNYFNLKGFVGKAIIFSFAIAMCFTFEAVAQVPMQQEQQQQAPVQDDFSEEELEQFVGVYMQAAEIQQKNESQMIAAIEEEEMDIDRFNEILMARQNQQNVEEIDATAEEMASFNNAAEKIMAVQQEAQAEIEELIENEMGSQKYQQIVMAYQQSPEVQEKVNQMLESEMGEGEGVPQGQQ